MTTENDRQVLNSILNPNLPLGEGVFDPEEKEAEAEELPHQVKIIQSKGMAAAEKGDVEEAIQIFNQGISECPGFASLHNNRAQAFRLAGRSNSALGDLNKAISLSGGKGQVAANAYCQRAQLYRKDGRDDEASADFKSAADLGSAFAKSMLVELNPYAAMCNAMLKNVFAAMAEGKPTSNVQQPFNNFAG